MKLTIKTEKLNRTYITPNLIPTVVISVLAKWAIDASFLDRICPILDEDKYINWKDAHKATLLAKFAIVAIKTSAAHEDIYDAIIDALPVEYADSFNREWWDNTTYLNEFERSVLHAYAHANENIGDDYRDDAVELWALGRITTPNSVGRHTADYLAHTYNEYLLGKLDVVETARCFAQYGVVSNIIFSYLKMDSSLLEAYRKMPGSASKLSKPKQVVLATAVVINADDGDNALAQLEQAIETVTSDLKNQIMKQWPK